MARIRIVMCAGVVPSELHGELGKTYSGLIPVAGISLLQRHVGDARAAGQLLLVTVDHDDLRSQKYLELLDTEFIKISGSSSISSALLAVLQSCFSKLNEIDGVELIFGDTLSDQTLPADAIAVVGVSDSSEWTQVNRQEGLLSLSSGISSEANTVAGYFSFSNPSLLCEILTEASDLWSALSIYDENVQELSIVELNSWLDFGRIDTLFKSRQVDFNARHFNHVIYQSESGTIRKSSTIDRRHKILAEASWFESLSKDQKVLSPALRNIDYRQGAYELEFVPTPTVAEIMLFGNMSTGYWERFFQALSTFLSILHVSPSDVIESSVRFQAMQDMYVSKLIQRLNEMQSKNQELMELKYEIDGHKCISVEQGFERVIEWGQSQIDNQFHFIHGDLFLGNMFFDRRLGLIRAIDPRGTFGSLLGQGDRRYDLAKLSHSLNGGYDLLAADLFRVTVSSNKVSVNTAISDLSSPSLIHKDQAFSRYCEEANVSMRDVRMIEAGLFLSMVPFHSESPTRQMALLATGLKTLDKVSG